MVYRQIEASKYAFKQLVTRMGGEKVSDVSQIERAHSVINAYLDLFPRNASPKLTNYLDNQITYSQDNLETKIILDAIIGGSPDLSILNRSEDTKWKTHIKEHAEVLDSLREQASEVYKRIDVAFMETDGYRNLVEQAKEDYIQFTPQFQAWESFINGLQRNDVDLMSDNDVALDIYNFIDNMSDMREYLKDGLSSLMYLEDEIFNESNGVSEVRKLIYNLALKGLELMNSMRMHSARLQKNKKLKKDIVSIVEEYSN